jgi:hypothetical protein
VASRSIITTRFRSACTDWVSRTGFSRRGPKRVLGSRHCPKPVLGSQYSPKPVLGNHHSPKPVLGSHRDPKRVLDKNRIFGFSVLGSTSAVLFHAFCILKQLCSICLKTVLFVLRFKPRFVFSSYLHVRFSYLKQCLYICIMRFDIACFVLANHLRKAFFARG